MKLEKKKKSVGVLFPHQKTKERSPDMTGQIQIQYEDLKQLVAQIDKPGDVAQGSVALWYYPADHDNEKGPYVSVQLSPPYRPKRKIQAVGDQEASLDEFFDEIGREANRDELP